MTNPRQRQKLLDWIQRGTLGTDLCSVARCVGHRLARRLESGVSPRGLRTTIIGESSAAPLIHTVALARCFKPGGAGNRLNGFP